MGRPAADPSQIRRSRLLGTLLLLAAACTAALAIGELLDLLAAVGASRTPVVVRQGPAVAISAALAIGFMGALCFARSPRIQRGLFTAALGSLALLPILVVAWSPFTRSVLSAHGYRSCGRADPASRLPSNIWTTGDPARCDVSGH